MKLVIDTNILVSFFRPNPVSELISKSNLLGIFLFSSVYNIEELKKNKSDVLKYSGLNSKGFDDKLPELLSVIKICPDELAKEFEKEAKSISPHDKDIPIFALALKLSCAIWSNEPSFKKQSRVKVLSTRDMIELFI